MGFINIKDTKLMDNTLTSRVEVDKNLSKYIKKTNLLAHYDADIQPNNSILNMPLLSTVLPLAWLTGTDIHVDELDRTFLESISELENEFKKLYPKITFDTKIEVNNIVDNKLGELNPEESTALLFSGGVDSTSSLIRHFEQKPRCITIWGVEGYPYPKYADYWERVIATYSAFLNRRGLNHHIIKSNPLDILNERRIEHDFHDQILDGTLWARLQHSLVILPLCAPLSIGRFDRLIYASTHDLDFQDSIMPWASAPYIDEKIRWANFKVYHDGTAHRYDKIRMLKGLLENEDLTLKVCMRREKTRDTMNCGDCEKCFRTIIPLLLEGVDPNKAGIPFNSTVLKRIRSYLENESISFYHITQFWDFYQKKVEEEIEYDLYGSKKFFEWFKTFNIHSRRKDVWRYRELYNSLPFPLAKILDELYKMMGLQIHDPSPVPNEST